MLSFLSVSCTKSLLQFLKRATGPQLWWLLFKICVINDDYKAVFVVLKWDHWQRGCWLLVGDNVGEGRWCLLMYTFSSEVPAVSPIHKHRAFEKLGLVGVHRIYIFLLDSIERFERMNKLLSYLLPLLLQTGPHRCHIRNSNYVFKWSITLVMNNSGE